MEGGRQVARDWEGLVEELGFCRRGGKGRETRLLLSLHNSRKAPSAAFPGTAVQGSVYSIWSPVSLANDEGIYFVITK